MIEDEYPNQRHLLSHILRELHRSNDLKERELKQQWFFIELIEEVLPIDDGKKRGLHQRVMRSYLYD